jgi:adenosylcobinamide kinase/adenosylcobinamide-phosphate guanylyltransferase
MGKITFVIGGARSGKSHFALKLAKEEKARNVAFIATCEALDLEMEKRITCHKKNRPKYWQTFEEVKDISGLLKKICNKFELILIDCLTLLTSNLLLNNFKEDDIEDEIRKILSILKKTKAKSIIVSNEVGLGIVPNNKLGRDYRDITGRINQLVAEKSNEVFFLVSGIPWRIK